MFIIFWKKIVAPSIRDDVLSQIIQLIPSETEKFSKIVDVKNITVQLIGFIAFFL